MRQSGLIFLLLLNWLAVSAQVFDVDTLQYSGNTDNRINLVILSDGYQEHELPQFAVDANAFAASFFAESPFAEYKSFFNVFIINVPSNESGAGHSGTATDVAEPAHPVKEADNYFGSAFDYFGIHRLLVPQNNTAITNVLANNFPTYDQVLILVNTPHYGGSGGQYATASLHKSATEIAIHEIGHSFTGLKDEYFAGDRYLAEAINMTQETDPEKVKWKNWLNYKETGIYQHCCNGNSASWYRPHENCKMRILGKPFCPVCVEGTVEKIHSLVSVVDSWLPAAEVSIEDLSPVTFSLDINKSNPNTIKVKWLLNGEEIETAKESVTLGFERLKAGTNTLQAVAEDKTLLVRTDKHSEIHSQTISWTIQNKVSDNAKLWALSVEDVVLSPAFTSATTAYTARVGHAVASVKITPKTENEKAVLTINGKEAASGAASSPVALNEGSNEIKIKVTAQDGKTIKTYTILVERESPPVKISPELAFSSQAISYTTEGIKLSAASKSSGVITYEVAEELTAVFPGDVGLSGAGKGTLKVVKSGKVKLKAVVAEDDKYLSESAEMVLTIQKATAKIILTGAEKVYDGAPKKVSVRTEPEGLPVEVYYNGLADAPVAAGEYSLRVLVKDDNYSAETEGTLKVAKASAKIAVSGLEKVYKGAPEGVSVSTIPEGLSTEVFYNGSKEVPVAAGEYEVRALVTDKNYSAEGNATLAIAKAGAKVSIAGQEQHYDGKPKAVLVKTQPEGLATQVYYNESTEVPVAAGEYKIRAVITNSNYSGEAGSTLTIHKAVAKVSLSGTDHEYNGQPKRVTVSTVPEGLATEILYNGSTPAPVEAGDYEVQALVKDPNYSGEAGSFLKINKANAKVSLSGLNHEYDGKPKAVLVKTEPEGLATKVYYNGSPEAPVAAGEYQVRAGIMNANYSGEGGCVLIINSPSADLSALAVGKAVLSPEFNSATMAYELKVGYAVASVKVFASTEDPQAMITINGMSVASGSPSPGIALQKGKNTIEVKVTAQDGLATKTYTITAERENPPAKIPPTLTFANMATTFGQADFNLSAATNSSGAITYEIEEELTAAYPGDVTLSGPGDGTLSLVKSGKVRLKVNVAEDEVYLAESAEMELTIHKATAVINISALNHEYDGEPKAVQVFTSPEGLAIEVRYNGTSEMPAEAGEHEVSAIIVDDNFTGEGKATLLINVPTAIPQSEVVKEVKLYPNPARNKAILELDKGMKAEMKVMDISGRFIEETGFSGSYELNLENYTAGTYLIVVQPEGKAPLYLKLQKQ